MPQVRFFHSRPALPRQYTGSKKEDLPAGVRLATHETDGGHHGDHTEGIPPQPQTAQLSAREAEVLALVAQGCLNKEIAQRLHIGLTTVISHRRNLTEKLGIRSVSGLTIYAVTMGYVDPEQI